MEFFSSKATTSHCIYHTGTKYLTDMSHLYQTELASFCHQWFKLQLKLSRQKQFSARFFYQNVFTAAIS